MMRSKPHSCAGCPLCDHGRDFSAVEGTGANGVLLVGEASGEHEQRDQLPFRPYAPSGAVLERCLRRMGLDRKSFAITNAVRCRPRKNWLEGAPWEYAALRQCRPNLDAVIAQYRPRCIVALGGVAVRELTGEAGEARGVTHLAGYVLPLQGREVMPYDTGQLSNPAHVASASTGSAIPVLADFHPSYLRRGKASYQGVFSRIIQRALAIASGRDNNYMWGVDPGDCSTWNTPDGSRLQYWTHPTTDQARSVLAYLRANSNLWIAKDIETSESSSLDEDAREGFSDTEVRLFQLSYHPGTGIAIPYTGEFKPIVHELLHLSNPSFGHNWDNFDHKVLRAASQREGWTYAPSSRVFDTLDMFHHWQPDLPAHLQFASGFVNFRFPWKHLSSTNIEFYGICDVDATLQLGLFLEATLKKDGLWGDGEAYSITVGYTGQEREVRPVLAAMEDRGVPIDDARRIALGDEFEKAQAELGVELDRRFPDEARSIHPKNGYKKTPKDLSGLVERDFTDAVMAVETGEPTTVVVHRWCRLEPFAPNSSQQLLRYMKHHGHKVPKSKAEDEDGNQKDTTAAKELQRLAIKTGDDFYLKVIEYRGLTKLRGTYVDGFKPASDGRVHTTFTFQTAIAQLSSRNPNCFSADTEVLCKRGWIKFPEITHEDYLAQYSNLGIISFAQPKGLIQRWSEGVLCHVYTDEHIDLMMTPGHNCLLRNRKSLEWKWINASDYPEDYHQMQAGTYDGGNLYYSEGQIALICALQADGHVSRATADYQGGAYEFAFTKERKANRLLMFLNDLGIQHSHHVKGIRHNIRISHKDVPEWWKDKKYFGPWVIDLTRDSLNYFEREVWFWDGCASKFSQYSSSVAGNADWVQIACILSNRRAKIRKYIPPSGNPNWQIDAIKDNYSLTTNRKNEQVPYEGLVYCATMPLGTLIVRRNGKVAITGNCTNFPKLKPTPALAKAIRGMICADEGCVIAEVDFKSCHVITLGLLAGDENYTRLGRLDIHSAVAGHFLGLWNLNEIIKETDDELMRRFKWLKSDPERKRVRDDQAKHGILGIGNGLRAKGLYERYMESFPSRGCSVCGGSGRVTGIRGLKNCSTCKGSGRQSGLQIAEAVLATCEQLFPRVFEYQELQRKEAHERQALRTPFGHQRRFYEVYRWDSRKGAWSHGDQAEEAVAYRLANTAHAHMREVMKELSRRGLDEKYGMFNMVHDSLMFSFREPLLGEFRSEVIPVMMAESRVLPGLWLGVEASYGRRWNQMKDLDLSGAAVPQATATATTTTMEAVTI